MISVFLELQLKEGSFDLFLELAKGYVPEAKMPAGMLECERFESVSRLGKILHQTTWRDRGALSDGWSEAGYSRVQAHAVRGAFERYSLSVGELIIDTEMTVPSTDCRLARFPDARTRGFLSLTEITTEAPGSGPALGDRLRNLHETTKETLELFASVSNPGKFALKSAWWDGATAASIGADTGARHRVLRVLREDRLLDWSAPSGSSTAATATQ